VWKEERDPRGVDDRRESGLFGVVAGDVDEFGMVLRGSVRAPIMRCMTTERGSDVASTVEMNLQGLMRTEESHVRRRN
jgi:hypothetical protein